MFDVGTRVVVLKSIFTGKIGPKVGSIGYARDVKLKAKPYYDENAHTLTSVAQVVFHRFGYEKSPRTEAKYFVNITPTCAKEESCFEDEQLPELISAHLRSIENFKPEGPFYDHLVYEYGKGNIYYGVLAPPFSIQSVVTNKTEFKAWANCITRSPELVHALDEINRNNKRIKKIVNIDYFELLRYMTDSQATREKVLNELGEKQYGEIVYTVRFLFTVYNRLKVLQRYINTKEWLSGKVFKGDHQHEIEINRVILGQFFNKEAETYIHTTKEANQQDKNLCRRMDYLLALRKILVSLARAVEVEHNN